MSTRSLIIVDHGDHFAVSYCHWDGKPRHQAPILTEHYASDDAARALSALGNLSSLGARVDAPDGHSYASPAEGCCIAYGRDRGEANWRADKCWAVIAAWPCDHSLIEWVYLWRDGAWWFASAEEGTQALRPCTDLIAAQPGVP